jgi:hypothetical protein
MNVDLDKYHKLLDKFFDIIDKLPLKKSNRKQFAIPYVTLFSLLSEYAPSDNTTLANEASLKKSIDSSLKSNDETLIFNTKHNLIQHLNNNRNRLEHTLQQSIEDYNDSFMNILDFFEKTCSSLSRKRKTLSSIKPQMSKTNNMQAQIRQEHAPHTQRVSQTRSKKYALFLRSHVLDIRTTVQSSIKCRILLKASSWKYVKKKIQNPIEMMVAMGSIIFTENIDCKKYLCVNDYDIEKLQLFFRIAKKDLIVLHTTRIIDYLSSLFNLNDIIDRKSYDLKSFVKKFSRKILKLSTKDKKTLFPGVEPSILSIRHILRMIEDSDKWKRVMNEHSHDLFDPHTETAFYKTVTLKDLQQMEQFSFIGSMSDLCRNITKYILVGAPFSTLLCTQSQYSEISQLAFDSLESIRRTLELLSKCYNVNFAVIHSSTNSPIDMTHPAVNSQYTVFVEVDHHNHIRLLKSDVGTITTTPESWQLWLKDCSMWNPKFSEIWSFFNETGEHVDPVKWSKDKSGIEVYGISFSTQNYKMYTKLIANADKCYSNGVNIANGSKLHSHGVYYMQYEDAFRFVKRQQSKRHKLHTRSNYQFVNILDLLYYVPFDKIHQIVCENARHGIYCENVSPIFRKLDGLDNSTMLKWYIVSNRFANRITGYFTELGSVYFEEIFNSKIDPVTESCIGYQWDKMGVFSESNIHAHNLTSENVALVIASIYMDLINDRSHQSWQSRQYCTLGKLEMCYVPIYNEDWDRMTKKNKLAGYFGTQNLENLEKYQGLGVKQEIISDFVEEYILTYGPFAVFTGGELNTELTNRVFDIQLKYKNHNNTHIENTTRNTYSSYTNEQTPHQTPKEEIIFLLKELGMYDTSQSSLSPNFQVHFSIPKSNWKGFLKSIPRTEKYERIRRIPKVPCVVRLKTQQIGVIQSYSPKDDKWRICVNGNNEQDQGVCYNLQSSAFEILEDERVLPAKCVISANTVHTSSDIGDFADSYGLLYGTAIRDLGNNLYEIRIDNMNMNNTLKLEKDMQFKWKDSVWLDQDSLKTTDIGNVSNGKKYVEDRTYDKSFANRGSKTKTKLYNPIRKDAYLPDTEDVDLPDYIIEDEKLCKFMDRSDIESIYCFVGYTGLEITADELYGLYGKIMDRNGGGEHMTYRDVLLAAVNELWKDMINDRLCFNVTGTFNKVGDDVVMMKERILKNIYGFD